MASKKPSIVQFGPDSQKPNEPGVYGWGFEVDGLRFVMYLPRQFDHSMIKKMEARQQARHKFRNGGEAGDQEFKSTRRGARRKIQKKEIIARDTEHGPAHVHVINMENHRESKLELVEPATGGGHFAQLLYQNGNGKTPLTSEEIQHAVATVNERVAEFIQLWRTAYRDSNLSGQVTRVSELFPENTMRIIYKRTNKEKNPDKIIEFEDACGSKCVFPFDDYVTASKAPQPPHR